MKNGYVVNASLANFLIPTAPTFPEIVPIVVEDPYPNGPFGAKGVGEPGTLATAAAVANAIYDAVGVRITAVADHGGTGLEGAGGKAAARKGCWRRKLTLRW